MDFGLKGKKAIVCAASKGLGRACALALAREGVELVITARTAADLEAAAAMIRQQTGAKVTAVAGDISTDAGRAAALAASQCSGFPAKCSIAATICSGEETAATDAGISGHRNRSVALPAPTVATMGSPAIR